VIKFQLITLKGIKFDNEVAEIILPTLDGEIGVLTDHMPLISVATVGVISVRVNPKDPDYKMEHYATNGGVIEVSNNVLKVIVDEADGAEEINESQAQKAYELAQKMKAEAKDELSLERAQSMIDRQTTRLKVSELRRRHKK
jgi:F-type H+-transporting ATPase subunit epsilon